MLEDSGCHGAGPASGCSSAGNAQYRFTPIDVPGAGATSADGNSTHEITGEFDDADGNTHGFVLSRALHAVRRARRGRLHQHQRDQRERRTVGDLLRGRAGSTGISGQGRLHHTRPGGLDFSAALFLNAQGQVTGYSVDATKTRHGFVWSRAPSPPSTCPARDREGPGPSGSTTMGRSLGPTGTRSTTSTGSC